MIIDRNLIRLATIGVVCVLLGAALGYWVAHRSAATPAGAAAGGERKVLYWTDPMVPGFRSDKPGPSPFMDMDLVPVYEGDAGTESVVTISPELSNSLGVRTQRVTRGLPARTTTASGYLARDGSGVLLLADVVERDSGWVKSGLNAEVRVADLPGRTFRARIERVEPDLDIGARSLRTRIRLLEGSPDLKANMLAEAGIHAPASGGKALLVPSEALIRTGTRNVVIVALDAGRFQPVDVVPGPEVGAMIEIRQGLAEGDLVVVSGQFLIDSEANLRASFTRMEPPEGTAPAPAAPAADPSQHNH